jgi:hypothetical protein
MLIGHPVFAALLLLTLTAGHVAARPAESLVPEGWDSDIRLTEAKDLNADPRIVEVNLMAKTASVEVAPGRRATAWTYDGGLPGPLIRGRVGDRLIVHFKNELPQPTTLHWHGVRVPIEMDGVPGISQPEVRPGESFTYDFVLRDAALYWYHPHVMSAAQVGFGLYARCSWKIPTTAWGSPSSSRSCSATLDVPLPHPGSRGGGSHGHNRCRRRPDEGTCPREGAVRTENAGIQSNNSFQLPVVSSKHIAFFELATDH